MPICLDRSTSNSGTLQSYCRPGGRVSQNRCRLKGRLSVVVSAESQQGNPLIKAGVSFATKVLSLVSPKEPEHLEDISLKPPRSVREVQRRLEADFVENQYFVTGDVDLGLYKADCRFADPTISFRGSRRYQKNLRNLRGFFTDPRIDLHSIDRAAELPCTLQAKWRLVVSLKFPWKPLIDIEGRTDYVLDDETLQISSHVESWNVSALEAVGQIFRLPR